MKQPELGRKISELRTAKGLTQEELVEKCNISVRTIQRVEAGEVTPRSYTIKTILAALDYDLSKISDDKNNFLDSIVRWLKRLMLIDINIEKPSDFLIKQLNIAWILGVFYFVIGFFEGAADYFLFKEDKMIFSSGFYIAIKVISLITFAFFQRGFILIGGLFRNYLLKIMSFIMIISIVVLNGYDIISLFYDSVDGEFIAGASALTFGIIGIIYGISLIRLKSSVGGISKYAGLLEIIGGCFLLTIALAFVGLLIYIPAELLEIIIIFKVIEIIKTKQTENNFA
ncbi:MAG: helix-turn-helix domain-containing protein [Tenuifilaceae bacterium]